MAVKKTQLYASLWASCDKLRGGMDSSEYKDYILTLLFMKYVTDKFKNKGAYEDIRVFDKAHDKDPDPEKRTGCSFDDFIALKGKKNIGEGMDKIIARLADENTDLKGVIDIAHFNDEKKLGSGKEMVDKLTDLISIFQRPELDFSRNKTEGDDIIGDAYEYLMRKFATESGKSKGQFYTPAEVSRILANVVGISRCTDTSATVCDPACGSGSLLIRAIDAAPIPIMGYGQEKESTTAGLAKMNAVLHRKAEITIKSGNTFSNPQYLDKSDNSILERFDYIVANPPFSMKNWRDGIAGKEYGRFEGYGDTPPEKNGDYAWLMHILKALKLNGKAAVILPHGVLFRGNAEATIREAIAIHAVATGTSNSMKNISKERLLEIRIPRPSIEEQKFIVKAISDIEALIYDLEKLIKKKQNIFTGTMQSLLSGKIRISDSLWEKYVIGDIGDFYSGLTGKQKDDFGKGNARYITFLNVLNNTVIDISKLESVQVNEDEYQNEVLKGDLFFNTSSETPEEVGMCAVLMDSIRNTYLNSFCFGFRLKTKKVYALFFSYYFNSQEGRKIMRVLAQGATRFNLSKDYFSQTEIELPPYEDQVEIAQTLADMEGDILSLEKKCLKYKAIKQGMMEELLTGKVRLV